MFYSLSWFTMQASHIVGGEMSYQYVGPGSSSANTSHYIITLKLFRDQNCTNCALMPNDVFIGIFNNDNDRIPGIITNHMMLVKSSEISVPVNPFPPCISNPPLLNYHVGIFILNVTLPNNTSGYTATYQTCCRVNPLENVFNNPVTMDGTGATYSCNIPAIPDNSAQFDNKCKCYLQVRTFCLTI